MFRSIGIAIVAAVLVGCQPTTEFDRDNLLVEGQPVGRVSWGPDECLRPPACQAIIDMAASRLRTREPGPTIVAARFHEPASMTPDGTLLAYSAPGYAVVFTLDDNSLRIEGSYCLGDCPIRGGPWREP